MKKSLQYRKFNKTHYGAVPAMILSATLIIAHAHADESVPAWLERSSLSVTEAGDNDVSFEFETIQPLMQTPETNEHTVFVQGRIAKQSDDETINIGLGYRNLNASQTLLLGVNAFYDMTTEYDHQRTSIGLEAIGKTFTARANIYSAVSDEKSQTDGAVTTYQSVLDGYDVSLDMPVPYTPWARFQATSYRYDALKGFDDVSGTKGAFIGNLNNNISFEIGAEDNNYNGTDAFVSVQYNLAGVATNGVTATLADGATSEAMMSERDLSNHVLDKVVRNNSLVVQTRGGVVIGRSN